jgi:hypothetical protein
MSLQDAQNLRSGSLDDWRRYQSGVWAATEAFLAATSDDALQEKVTVKPLGEMPKQKAVGMMCLTRGFTHLGEIQHVRGLLGLRGMAW